MVDKSLRALYKAALKNKAKLKQKRGIFRRRTRPEVEITTDHWGKDVHVLFVVSPWEHYAGWEELKAPKRYYECSYMVQDGSYNEARR